jgi:hypothetical protein
VSGHRAIMLRHNSTHRSGGPIVMYGPPSDASNLYGTWFETSAFDGYQAGFGIADGVVDPSGRKALGGHHVELRQPAVLDGLRGFDEPAVDNTPHEGHAAAVGSAVTACTTRVPSARRSTCSTRHAWQPENNVVPSDTTPWFPSSA